MKSEIVKKTVKMLFDVSEVSKTQVSQNIINAAKQNDIKITHEDLQKLIYIVNSSIDTTCLNSSRNFENRLVEMVDQEVTSKSSKTK